MRRSLGNARYLLGTVFMLCLLFVAGGSAQNKCIIDQPLPKLPDDYGVLDAQTHVVFRVDFRSDATIGKIALISKSGIDRLDALATEAVPKITFIPQKVDGSAIPVIAIVEYKYSWRYSGWKVAPHGEYCPKKP